ncbi:uncharacterized protein LOC128681102 [Plodia interpunctella]|uniref:uncharacterized protein LOC128681102 n=1 Tax=Plodia interpunctella TaxID=58824 RepID=UPI002367C3E9|nr:uncharacterized protein LOC128681102 [Plodia interpunctella]
MLGLDLDAILLFYFMILFADPILAGSKKKDLSRFTQSLDLVSVLKMSLRKNNDDYQDSQPDNPAIDTVELININRANDSNRIDYARRSNRDDASDSIIDTVRVSILKEIRENNPDEKHSKSNFMNLLEKMKAENVDSNKKPEEIETKSDENQSKSFSKSLNETLDIRVKLDDTEKEPELSTVKDPMLKAIEPHSSMNNTPPETSLAPYLLGKETTARLKYKLLTVKGERAIRRGAGAVPHFLQTELSGRAVLVAPVHVAGPVPDFKLPKSRRQYRVDSDDENAEGNSAVSGDDDALVPR